jgi:lipopolysaccharide transport system permease protein
VTTPAEALRHDGGTTVIRPERGVQRPDLRELWDYRDLLYYLVRRDFLVRYKQSIVGPLWAILQPIGFTVVFSVFLGNLANVPSQKGIPYPLFALAGLAMWLFISKAVQSGAESTVNSADLLAKIYFPRMLIPLSALLASVMDFLAALVVVIAAMFLYGEPPGPELLAMPAVLALAMLVAFGGGLWFSALFVRYRDIRHLLAFLLLAGMFVTPIVYPFELVPENLQTVYALNPLVGVLELYRWTLFGDLTAGVAILLIPLAVGLALVVSGALYFRSTESTFADVI